VTAPHFGEIRAQQEVVSDNWAGIIDTGTTFTGASTEWIVPEVQVSSTTEVSATWVGLDGVSSSDPEIIQTGTTQVTSGGETAYFAWYELYPEPTVLIGGVSPGDLMSAVISEDSTGVWTVGIEDMTSAQVFSTEVNYSGPGESAEWIEEAPTNSQTGQIETLADFGSIAFDDVKVGAASQSGTTLTYAEMENSGDQIIAYPSSFDNSTDSFTVTYGTPPPSPSSAPTVTSIVPSSGPTTGGTTVEVYGTILSGATSVNFGSTPARKFNVDSDTQITATSPPEQAGAVNVTITTSAGTSATSASDLFTYIAAASVQRIYGEDAIGTSIAVSQASFPTAGSAQAVVLARSDYFSDALAGGPLAAQVRGPLLITPGASISSSLDPRVLAEIQRVLPSGGTVYILGGQLALGSSIDTSLQSLGYKTQRVEGSDEYATAVAIAQQMGDPSTIFETTGLSFYDALSAVPAVIDAHGAILLTEGATQAPETAAYLASYPSDTRYAIGGPLAAAGADPSATAVWGQDLYGTAEAVATTFFPSPTSFGAATSASFADALSGGPMLGRIHAPMLLVPSSGPLPASIADYLSGVVSGLTSGTLFGGPLAVGDDVLAELDAIL
jgi:hypothetical protein